MSRWRTGGKVPINVYDGDRPVCRCHTVADARRIVAAANVSSDAEPTGLIVCPHCSNGQEDVDYCDDKRFEGIEECEVCGKKYRFRAEVDVRWVTEKISDDGPAVA